MFTRKAITIFKEAIKDFHVHNDVHVNLVNPYDAQTIEGVLYKKAYIDTVQWHLEDIIREPTIEPNEAVRLKRWIDKSNQHRTDTVEQIDSYFLEKFKKIKLLQNARINTESPAWAFDRLSILQLKIFHMAEEANRSTATEEHKQKCSQKLAILKEQEQDLVTAINELLEDMEQGKKYMKVYKQMKMYNDPSLNPVLYSNKK